MNKEKYLKIRKEIASRNITNEGIDLLQEYWEKNKAEEYINLTPDEFKINIVNWLQSGGNLNVNRVLKYFDDTFVIVTLKDKDNNVLTLI